MKTKQRGETILVIVLLLVAIGGWFTKEHDRRCTNDPQASVCQEVTK